MLCQPDNPQPWAQLAVGQKVRVTGLAGKWLLVDAKFALDGPSMLQAATAEALATEYAKNPRAMLNKYDSKDASRSLIVTGTLIEKQINSGKPSVLILGKADQRILCEYSNDGADLEEPLGALKVGETVKLAGEVFTAVAVPGSGETLRLTNCNLITK